MVTMRRAALAAVLGFALVGVAAPATAADVDVAPPGDAHPYYQVDQVVISDGAVYIATGYYNENWHARETQVWRRTLHEGPAGTTLGNAQYIDASVPLWWGRVLAANDDAILFIERSTGRLVRHTDAGAATHESVTSMPTPMSYEGPWYTGWDRLWAVPNLTGTGDALVGRSTEPWPWAVGQLSPTGAPPQVGAAVVAWIEGAVAAAGGEVGRRVYANALDATGLVGQPVVLDQTIGTAGEVLSDVHASDDVVVWLALDATTGHGALRWVPAGDLTAEPQELALNDPGDHVVLDGTRVAFHDSDADAEWTTVVDLATLGVVATVPGAGMPMDLQGELLARAVRGGDGNQHVLLTSITGAGPAVAPHFSDVTVDNRFVTAIDRLSVTGVTTGYPDGTFRPLGAVTREAMAAFLYRQAGEPAFTPPATSPFTDVATGHPFYAEITWLADAGITTGWDDGDGTASFRPGEPVSREAMAAFLYRAAGEPAFTPPATSPFTDVAPSHPFYAPIAWLAQTGISTGWRTAAGAEFRPGANIERQAMAAFLLRFAALPV